MRSSKNDPVCKLSQYWVSAGIMRKHVIEYKERYPDLENMNDDVWGDFIIYTSFWLSALYVVIEGFRDLGLSDKRIDVLLVSKNVDSLRVYRNSTFHFQKTSNKHNQFYEINSDRLNWALEVYLEFGRYFSDYQ